MGAQGHPWQGPEKRLRSRISIRHKCFGLSVASAYVVARSESVRHVGQCIVDAVTHVGTQAWPSSNRCAWIVCCLHFCLDDSFLEELDAHVPVATSIKRVAR
jgi:hypothetical protein